MNSKIVLGIIGAVMLASWPLAAMDQQSGGYCAKHCNTMQLSKEVKSLEQQIGADRAALKSGGSGEKLATLNARKDQVKKHLDQHLKELTDLKAQLEKDEAELSQMGSK